MNPRFRKVQGWRLQLSWDEIRKTVAGQPYRATFSQGAVIVQGLRDWAESEARSLSDALIAQRPDGSVINVQVQGQRQHLTIDGYTEDIASAEHQGDSFVIEALMEPADFETPSPLELRRALGGGTDLFESPPDKERAHT